jgi:hypothetical protein
LATTDNGPGDLGDALDILMDVLLDAAEEENDVRESLLVLREWMAERMEELGPGGPARRLRGRRDAGRGRGDGPPRRRGGEEIDLETVRQRALIKCEACRFASYRRRLLARGADPETEIDPRYKELIGRAKALNGCYAWPLDSNRQLPGDNELELLARCYENVAFGVEIAQRFVSSPGSEGIPTSELLYLLAETQSALRAALGATDLRNDEDQIQTYIWVKEQAYDQDIYVSRYMRMEDPADPLIWADLRKRLEAFAQGIKTDPEGEEQRRELLERVRESFRDLAEGEPPGEAWGEICEVLDEWVGAGRPAASRELCGLIMPWSDRLPEGLSLTPTATAVLSEAKRLREAREARAAARSS